MTFAIWATKLRGGKFFFSAKEGGGVLHPSYEGEPDGTLLSLCNYLQLLFVLIRMMIEYFNGVLLGRSCMYIVNYTHFNICLPSYAVPAHIP